MSRAESMQDSSMEEILASIRRIISEDATPPKPQSALQSVMQPAPAPVPRAAMPNAAPIPAPPPLLFTGLPLSATPAPVPPEDDDILDLGADYTSVTRVGVLPPQSGSRDVLPQEFAAMQPVTMPVPELTPPPPVLPESVAVAKFEPVATPWSPPPLPEPVPTPLMASIEAFEPPALPLAEPAVVSALPAPEVVQAELPAALAEAAAITLEAPAQAEGQAGSLSVLGQSLVISVPAAVADLAPMAGSIAEPAKSELAAAAAAPGARTLEDSVADLLRPMLRDWLDTNMPRIVEKMAREGR